MVKSDKLRKPLLTKIIHTLRVRTNLTNENHNAIGIGMMFCVIMSKTKKQIQNYYSVNLFIIKIMIVKCYL